jgi:glycine cleavage system H protein
MNVPENLKYTKDHEWVLIDGNNAVVGITDYAQGELGDIVFIEMPKIGQSIKQLESCGSIEAVKTVSDIYAPLSGEVIEINNDLDSDPQLINQDPYNKGWIFKVKVSNQKETDNLLLSDDYKKLIE